ncbi:hypothetical protein TNCV_1344901 [Trichonephila clavipes]|nr:hypothetical protein TNCV_1344901 [Trichonephila clavipes]
MSINVQKNTCFSNVLEAKLEEFADDALTYAKSLYEELEISFEPPRRIRRKHIFGNRDKDAPLLYEDDLRSEVIVSMDELNLDQAPQDINKEEFQLERVRLQAFVAATDPGCKKRTHKSVSLGLLKYIIESKLEDGFPNIVIMLRIFLTFAISNASCERSFSKLKLIKNYLRSTMSTLRQTDLAILAIEHDIHIDIDNCIRDFVMGGK